MTDAPGIDITGVGPVDLDELRGDLVTVVSPAPQPPGTRLSLCRHGADEVLAQGKVTSVAVEAEDPPLWRLSIKLFSVSRAAREVLQAAYQKKVPPR